MATTQVKRVGVLSFAKMLGVVWACLGLIIGIIYGLIFMVFGAAIMASGGGGDGAAVGGVSTVVVGLLFIVGLPIFYGVFGFIGGAISAVVYNVAAGFVGGVELELESAERVYAAPPQPQWNAAPPPQPPGQQPYSY